VRLTGLVVAAALAGGCARDAVGECPAIGVGDLVVTEFRGPQSDMADQLGSWVELYNATSGSLDLEGIKVRFRTKDGSSEIDILVRRSVPIAAGGYAVLGLAFDGPDLPSAMNYGFADDFASQMRQSFLPAAAVDVESCGTRIDRAVYDVLPKLGVHSLGGTPDATANDVPANWCDLEMPAGGTPQQANPACP
jgi:hypothetical protein